MRYTGLLGRPLRSHWYNLPFHFAEMKSSNIFFPLGQLAEKPNPRTNKADIVVGVDIEVAENLDKSGEKWRVNGW